MRISLTGEAKADETYTVTIHGKSYSIVTARQAGDSGALLISDIAKDLADEINAENDGAFVAEHQTGSADILLKGLPGNTIDITTGDGKVSGTARYRRR